MHLRTLFFTNPNCSISLLALRYSPSYSPSQSKNDKGKHAGSLLNRTLQQQQQQHQMLYLHDHKGITVVKSY